MTMTMHRPGQAAARLRQALGAGRFLFTAELECPRTAAPGAVERQAFAYAPWVDAIDCTDNAGAVARLDPLAAAALALPAGVPTLIQLTGRDRNALGVQSALLGAAALGCAGVVAITGDPLPANAEGHGVYDHDSVSLMSAAAALRATAPPADLVIGGVENPWEAASLARLARKAAAGAEFVQTQMVFDVAGFARWWAHVRAAHLEQRVRVLAGVAVVRRRAIAERLATTAPGVVVPAATLARLSADVDEERAGVALAAATIRALRPLPGLAGIHLLTFGWAAGVERVMRAL